MQTGIVKPMAAGEARDEANSHREAMTRPRRSRAQPMSSITIKRTLPPRRHPVLAIIGVVLSMAVLVAGIVAVQKSALPFWPWMAGIALYLLIAWFVVPQADTGDMGLFGGLVDNPFRLGDDVNRFLLTWFILLWPGRLVMEGLLGGLVLLLPGNPDAA